MKSITGIDPWSGRHIEVRFSTGSALDAPGVIDQVTDVLASPEGRLYVSPGFIDVQVNGFGGVDYNEPSTSVEQIGASLETHFATGVTRIFPTVITGSQERLAGCLKMLAEARRALPHGDAIEGFHVEGPHISPEDGPRGAHPVEHVRRPSIPEYEELQAAAQGDIKLVTVAPEWPEAPEFIRHVTRQGVVVSLGHTKANRDQIKAAVDAGASMSTHLGNGAHQQMLRHPNYIWEQMAEDRLTASFICDGIHLGPAFIKSAIRAKGIERSVLVTDAVMPAGCAPGPYTIGGVQVVLHEDRRVTLAISDKLAGSSLKMDYAIQHVQQAGEVSLAEALTMATRNAARAGRIAGRQRGLQPGERADLVLFTYDSATKAISVKQTYLSGKLVYQA